MTLNEYMEAKNAKASGEFADWKKLEENSARINFLLDHCTPEEQSQYLRDFDTMDLAKFLQNNINNLSESELETLASVNVDYHALPILNSIMGIPHKFHQAFTHENENLSELHKLRIGVGEGLKKKMQEIEWRRIDAGMTESSKEIKLKK